jgi:hypothetical protein
MLTARANGNDSEMRALLARPFDWDRLCALALADRATSVVWRSLQRLGCNVPDAVAKRLSHATAVSEFSLMRADVRLRETIRALGAQGIRVVLLKGAALVHVAYTSITERPMADFDLLVDPSRIDEAQRIAMSLGWARSPSAGPDFAYRTHHHAVPLVDDTGGTRMQLELHTGLFIAGHPFALSADAVRRRARPLEIDGCLVGVPARSVLILHACLHFAWSHGMRKGGWRTLRDIARLAEGRDKVWDDFASLAIESRGATCCYWTLRLARELAAVPVPDHVLSALRPDLPEVVLTRIGRHFALQVLASDVVCPSAVVDRAIWTAAILPRSSGHGPSRPWAQTHDFLAERPQESRARRFGNMVSRQLGLIPQWSRYVGAIVADRRRAVPSVGEAQ